MGHGTTVKVYASRIHRCNAGQMVDESKHMKSYIERTLIAMAAARGEVIDGCNWYEHVVREVPSLLEEYADACFKETMATLIIENPEDADDDYDEEEQHICAFNRDMTGVCMICGGKDEIPEAGPATQEGGAA